MRVLRQSGFVSLRATLLTATLLATPIIALTAHISRTTASPDKNVCVTAMWKANYSITSDYGACPDLEHNDPVINPSVTASPSPTSGSATPTPTPSASSSPTASATATDGPSEGTPATGGAEPTDPPTSLPTADPTAEPTPTETTTPDPTPEPTVAPSPTPTQTTVVSSPSPTPSPSPTVAPAPVIPPENTDPKTKEFMFCHSGAMHSNSFNGMMNGHHDKHATDIIPPIPFKFYGGWNWNAANAKTFYNNCVPVR